MWEIGKRTPKHKDLVRCEERMGTNGRLASYLKNWVPREIAHEWLDKWILIEEQATQLQSLGTSVVPGLLANRGLRARRPARRGEGQRTAGTASRSSIRKTRLC